MIDAYNMLSDWKQSIHLWRKRVYIIGIMWGVLLWACTVTLWPVLLVWYLVVNR